MRKIGKKQSRTFKDFLKTIKRVNIWLNPSTGQVTANTNSAPAWKTLSGTGSVGATIRIYFEKYEDEETQLFNDTSDSLKEII